MHFFDKNGFTQRTNPLLKYCRRARPAAKIQPTLDTKERLLRLAEMRLSILFAIFVLRKDYKSNVKENIANAGE